MVLWYETDCSNIAFVKLFVLRLSGYQECRTLLIIPSGLGKCLLSPGRLLQTNIKVGLHVSTRGHYSDLIGLFVLALIQTESRNDLSGQPYELTHRRNLYVETPK